MPQTELQEKVSRRVLTELGPYLSVEYGVEGVQLQNLYPEVWNFSRMG